MQWMNEMKSNFTLYTDFNSAVFKTEMETIFIKLYKNNCSSAVLFKIKLN